MFRLSPNAAALFAGAPCGALSLTPLSASAGTEFMGGGYMTDFAGCATSGWNGVPSMDVVARSRPAGMTGNHPTYSDLTLFLPTGTINFRFEPDENWFPTTETAIYSRVGESSSMMRITSVDPADLDESVEFFFIEAEVSGFSDEAGCSVRVHLVFAPR